MVLQCGLYSTHKDLFEILFLVQYAVSTSKPFKGYSFLLFWLLAIYKQGSGTLNHLNFVLYCSLFSVHYVIFWPVVLRKFQMNYRSEVKWVIWQKKWIAYALYCSNIVKLIYTAEIQNFEQYSMRIISVTVGAKMFSKLWQNNISMHRIL